MGKRCKKCKDVFTGNVFPCIPNVFNIGDPNGPYNNLYLAANNFNGIYWGRYGSILGNSSYGSLQISSQYAQSETLNTAGALSPILNTSFITADGGTFILADNQTPDGLYKKIIYCPDAENPDPITIDGKIFVNGCELDSFEFNQNTGNLDLVYSACKGGWILQNAPNFGEIQTQNYDLWTNQYTSYTLSDGSPSSIFATNYNNFYSTYNQYAPCIDFYPPLYPEYYKWFDSGFFPENSTIFSTTEQPYTIPVVTPTITTTNTPAAGSLTNVVVGTFASNNEYYTAGTVGFTLPVKQLLETPSGNWFDNTNKTANGVVLAQYTVTATTTFTISNVRFKYVAFYFNNTNNLSLIFNGTNIVFENCVFNFPRNEGDGCLYFNVTSGGNGVSIRDCVFRNSANVERILPLGTNGLVSAANGGNIVVKDNWWTTNYTTSPSTNIARTFFIIPNTITNDILGNIYITNNNIVNTGLANSNAYTDSSGKGFFYWQISAARTYTFKTFIDNNTFTSCPVFNDHGLIVIAGQIPAAYIGQGFFYVNNTDIPDTYKKIIVYSLQTLPVASYNTPIFYTD